MEQPAARPPLMEGGKEQFTHNLSTLTTLHAGTKAQTSPLNPFKAIAHACEDSVPTWLVEEEEAVRER